LEAFAFRCPEPTRMSDEILTVQEVATLLKVADKTVYTMAQKDTVAPNGFKGMVVTFDQECCLLSKAALDKILPPEATEVVISATGSDERFKPYARSRDEEEKILDRFRDPNDPLKLLIVTAKLLTGFDAPILQAMYLDKPLRDHTLLQAICRMNRTYGDKKTHGLIVDYLGVFDDVAKALEFDEKGFRSVVGNIEGLKDQMPEAMQKCLAFFPGIDRAQTGYEGLMAAQECLPNNDVRDAFAAEYSVLGKLWEAISPDPMLLPFEVDYRWLTQVYVSVQPTSGTGKRLVVFDYFLVHSDDIEGGPEGLHSQTPHRGGEILVRRGVLQEGLTLHESRGLVERVYKDGGIFFAATDKSADFLDTLSTEYLRGLRERADWFTGNDQGRRGFIPQPAGVA
jgi:ABC-3C biological conflict system middle component/UvrB-like protein